MLLMLAIAAVTTLGAAWLIWFMLGNGRLPKLNGDTAGLELIKVALAITAGIGATVALVVAYRKQRLSEAAEKRERAKHFHERYVTASEQLYSATAGVRQAGVYAMASLADDWDEGRQNCIDVLCGYMRMPYTPPEQPVPEGATPQQVAEYERNEREASMDRHVRRAVMDTIGWKLRAVPVYGNTWHEHIFDLTGAVIDGGDLSGARIIGGWVKFDGARFTGKVVRFNDASFSGGFVTFNDATFDSGHVDFRATRFSDVIVDFSGAKFSGATVSFDEGHFGAMLLDFRNSELTSGFLALTNAEFAGSTVAFDFAQLQGGKLGFDNSDFSAGSVGFEATRFGGSSVQFDNSEFTGAAVTFAGAKFLDGRVTFHNAAFRSPSVGFKYAHFKGATVDLSTPNTYTSPPSFDDFPDGVPEGLILPDPVGPTKD
ncbi:MAG TPA: hypothetical protein VE172_11690 [Stackebrandtia sp.]|uniref:pentapeptide repeat-containing protein n=1 Tax=Stackebrandtia sp. TaxID=2023065 RepID=UPI002D65BA09|nr:hypothetical protein [Stackebrandtia sp.]HZE39460.1 hypothetical protein [Stackebrandtia sp.]